MLNSSPPSTGVGAVRAAREAATSRAHANGDFLAALQAATARAANETAVSPPYASGTSRGQTQDSHSSAATQRGNLRGLTGDAGSLGRADHGGCPDRDGDFPDGARCDGHSGRAHGGGSLGSSRNGSQPAPGLAVPGRARSDGSGPRAGWCFRAARRVVAGRRAQGGGCRRRVIQQFPAAPEAAASWSLMSNKTSRGAVRRRFSERHARPRFFEEPRPRQRPFGPDAGRHVPGGPRVVGTDRTARQATTSSAGQEAVPPPARERRYPGPRARPKGRGRPDDHPDRAGAAEPDEAQASKEALPRATTATALVTRPLPNWARRRKRPSRRPSRLHPGPSRARDEAHDHPPRQSVGRGLKVRRRPQHLPGTPSRESTPRPAQQGQIGPRTALKRPAGTTYQQVPTGWPGLPT